MKDQEGRRARWQLTQDAFDTLLRRLADDRDQAGERFEALRHNLLQFFSYEASVFPERWADETLDRLAKRLYEGAAIDDVVAFARGISKMVLREARQAERRERELEPQPRLDAGAELERDASCLEGCLKKLPAEHLALVEDYYLSSFKASQPSAVARKALAEKLGVSQEALRSRAMRIRKQLERCLQDCRESATGSDMVSEISPDRNEGRRR